MATHEEKRMFALAEVVKLRASSPEYTYNIKTIIEDAKQVVAYLNDPDKSK